MKPAFPLFLGLCFMVLSSCGPSPEVIGTQTSISSSSTAAAWTPTITSTETPTPIPISTPTKTPTITPSPTSTPNGGSNQMLICGRHISWNGVPSIYLYDFKIGSPKLLIENYALAEISPDEKNLMVFVLDWNNDNFMKPRVGELYLTKLEGYEPILISSYFLTNGSYKWIDFDTFHFSEMNDGIIKHFEYKVSSASVNELFEPDQSNDNFDLITGMFKTYPPGECQRHKIGKDFDWSAIVDCASQNGQYIWREESDYEASDVELSPSILRIDGSVLKDFTLEEVFPGSQWWNLRGFWSPNSQFLILIGDTSQNRELGIFTIADLGTENVDLPTTLPKWLPGIEISKESFSPDGNQIVLWHHEYQGPFKVKVTTLILDLPTNTMSTVEFGLPENTYLERILWLQHEVDGR